MHAYRVVALLLVVFFASACQSLADQYTYFDDFSTDKAMADSYSHSDFVVDLPDPWPVEGFLRYEAHLSDRMLAFYYGSSLDSYAWLRYEFPIGSSGAPLYQAGALEFDLINTWEGGWIRCGCSFDGGASWEWTAAAAQSGHYSFDFTAPSPSEGALIAFQGCDACIDGLEVRLYYWTPVEASSWSHIKQLFRLSA